MDRRIACFVALASLSCSASASDNFRFGVLPTISNYSVKDTAGPTANKSGVTPLSGVVIFDIGRDSRLFVQAYSESFTLDASTPNVGQEVKRAGVNASYQRLVRFARDWKPWFGAGFGYSSETYTLRHTTTATGFLENSYPDRNIDNYSFLINASNEWKLNRDWDIGLHVQFEKPLSDGTRVFRLGVYAVY